MYKGQPRGKVRPRLTSTDRYQCTKALHTKEFPNKQKLQPTDKDKDQSKNLISAFNSTQQHTHFLTAH
jgi:hypothetical protein